MRDDGTQVELERACDEHERLEQALVASRQRQEELLARLADRADGAGAGVRSRADELVLLTDIGRAMRDASICGLGQTASSAIESALREPALVGL